MDKLKFLWEKLGAFDALFEDDERGDFETFTQRFLGVTNGVLEPTGLFWEVDDIGIFLIKDILPAEMASVHFNFWDKKFSGREQLCIEALKFAFDQYKFHKLYTTVPVFARKTMWAVERLGFIHEGRHRKEFKFKGTWFDVNSYSILKDEVVGMTRQTGLKKRRSVCVDCGEKYSPKGI